MHLTLVSAPLPVDASLSLCPILSSFPPWPPLLMPKRFLCPRGSRGTATAVPVEVPRADALVRWTRLPVAGEYKSRLKRQKAAASRFVLSCSTVQCVLSQCTQSLARLTTWLTPRVVTAFTTG